MKPTSLYSILCLLLLVSPIALTATTTTNPPTHTARSHLSFAAITDTHIGIRYQKPLYTTAHHLDSLADDLTTTIPNLQFILHLGDIINHNTAQASGTNLPHLVNHYTNNLKAVLLSHTHLPFYPVIGNHDETDYQLNPDNPHNLTQSILDETSHTTPTYAMMYDNILFLIVPELDLITWTHPTLYAWIEAMTSQYPTTTTIICCHQAIQDTTNPARDPTYSGKQDNDWWIDLFQHNPQIIMWIHGHNHYQDWYADNHSNGLSIPITSFGHTMIFSAPYSQTTWEKDGNEDDIVIYNISSTSITAQTWNHTSNTGRWDPSFSHIINISTTFNPEAADWYSFPVFLQDNETQSYDLKVLSPDITLQLIGTPPMDLFSDPRMESPGSRGEHIIGFGNDRNDQVTWTDPGMKVTGPILLTFPEKYPIKNKLQEDGRSGQPYNSFPMGTIAAAIPGQTYMVTVTGHCPAGNGLLTVNMSCSDWASRSQYSELANSSQCVLSHCFGSENETLSGQYTVPLNQNAWFLQGELQFLDSTDYEVSLFSIQRARTSDTTDDLHVRLNDKWYNVTGPLCPNAVVNFSIDPFQLSDSQGIMTFTGKVGGNHYGITNMVFREPLFFGVNARFRIDSSTDKAYNLTLTQVVSHASPWIMNLWQSRLFHTFPKTTELLARMLLLVGMPRQQTADVPLSFELTPFSINPVYGRFNFTADDGSGIQHESSQGNLWWTCNGPSADGRSVTIRFDDP